MNKLCVLPLATVSVMLIAAAAPHRLRQSAASKVAAANNAATIGPDRDSFVNANAVSPYSDSAIYQVLTAPERVTDIFLQPGETLTSIASGDTARWVIGNTTSGSGADQRTHILVKPYSARLTTNLVVTTDRRTYHLSLASSSGPSMASLSWTYPKDALIAYRQAAKAAAAAAPVADELSLDALRFDYTISGDHPSWRPLRAFDDGRQTFIEFPASLAIGEAPPLFLVDRHGAAQLVNYRQRGHFYVVDRIFDAAELRLGTKHQAVVRITRDGRPS